MIIIVNELSLTGQFESVEAFIQSLVPSVKLINLIAGFRIPLHKNQMFYNSAITNEFNLHFILTKYKSNEDIRGFAKRLHDLYKPPYWEIDQKHSCDDAYTCQYTNETCNFGLAEAVENDKIVFSFSHDDFRAPIIHLQKNGAHTSLDNIFELENFKELLLMLIKANKIELYHEEKIFTYEETNKLLLKYYNYTAELNRKNTEEKIALYEKWAELLGLINGWKYSTKLSKKNNRSTYVKTVNGNDCHLEVDTEKGCFEFWQNGVHFGEYDFEGIHFSKGIKTRTTHG